MTADATKLREEDGYQVLDDDTEARIRATIRDALGKDHMYERPWKQMWVFLAVVMVAYLALLGFVALPLLHRYVSEKLGGQLFFFLMFPGIFVVGGFAFWWSPFGAAERRENRLRRQLRAQVWLERREEALARARKALAWWATEGALLQDPSRLFDYARIHGDAALAREQAIATAYHDTDNPCATIAGAQRLAETALREMPDEVGRYIGGAAKPTAEGVANVLLQHHSFEFERLLPKAREVRAARVLGKQPATTPDYQKDAAELVARVAPKGVVSYADGQTNIEEEVSRRILALRDDDPDYDDKRAQLNMLRVVARSLHDANHPAPVAPRPRKTDQDRIREMLIPIRRYLDARAALEAEAERAYRESLANGSDELAARNVRKDILRLGQQLLRERFGPDAEEAS